MPRAEEANWFTSLALLDLTARLPAGRGEGRAERQEEGRQEGRRGAAPAARGRRGREEERGGRRARGGGRRGGRPRGAAGLETRTGTKRDRVGVAEQVSLRA